jgi:hypothetical protein
MAAQTESVVPDSDQSKFQPIEFLTENGYSIFRQWELDHGPTPKTGSFAFSVCSEDGRQRNVIVEIADDLVTRIHLHTRGRILLSNSFWIYCAERNLATYLVDHDECPDEGKLCVNQLTPRDLNLSIRWERTEENA